MTEEAGESGREGEMEGKASSQEMQAAARS